MASLQERNGSYRVLFSHRGKLHSFTLGRVTPEEADSKARQVDYLLMRLKQRLVHLPDGTDIVSFVESDGQGQGTFGRERPLGNGRRSGGASLPAVRTRSRVEGDSRSATNQVRQINADLTAKGPQATFENASAFRTAAR